MSSFKFIKKHKPQENQNNNIQNNQFDMDSKSKNLDSFNGAAAQPAQSINPPTETKKGFSFIKKKNNVQKNNNGDLGQSNASINSNDMKFISTNNNTNNNNNYGDLDSLINNSNELLAAGKLSNEENNININSLGENNFQNYANIEDNTLMNNNYSSEAPIIGNFNNLNNNNNYTTPEYINNNNNFNNTNYIQEEKEKPKEKKSGFSFVNKKPKKTNNNFNNYNNISNNFNNDANNNNLLIANKTPLSSSMSDKFSEKSGNQNAYSNNVETPIENDALSNNNETETYDNLNMNLNSNNNNYNEEINQKKEEIKNTDELNEDNLNLKYNLRKNEFINEYIKYINELHSKKIALQKKELDLSLLNIQKDNLMKEEQKAIDDNDYEKAESIENTIKDLKNKANILLGKIEEDTHNIMNIKHKELEINDNLLSGINELSNGYNFLKKNLEKKIENFTNNELVKHQGENIRLEKLKEKLEFLKNNLEQEKGIIDSEQEKVNNLIKGQSAGIFEALDNLNNEKKTISDEIEEIRKKLEEKEKELEKVNIKIDNKQKEIDAVKSNFTYEFKKIDIKKKNYEDNMKDYEEQNTRYNTELITYQENDEKNKVYLEKLNNELNYYNDKIDVNQVDYNEKKVGINQKEILLKEENNLHNKIFESNKKVNEINKLIESHHNKIQLLKVNNKIMQGEINQIEIKLPALEEEKKSYIQFKNFKEAGRVNKELKESKEKKNINLEKIEKNKKEIENYEGELMGYQKDIETYENENKNYEKELDISKYKNLLNSLNSMNTFYNNNQKSAKIFEEIKLTNEQINELKKKEYVLQYIKDNDVKEEEKVLNEKEDISNNISNNININKDNKLDDNNNKGDETTFSGFNLINDENKDNNNNTENKIKELEEKLDLAVKVSNI